MQVTVIDKQTMIDIPMQEYGAIDKLFIMAQALNKSITADLMPGELLIIPVVQLNAKEASISYLLKKAINVVASGELKPGINRRGIGYMKIGATFIVS
jgi:hypothetical protein